MSISLTFTSNQTPHTFIASESRIARMMNSDKETATYMGWWDTFKDFFRTDKKQDALDALYDVIHGESGVDTLKAFYKLKSYAGDAQQPLFIVKSEQGCLQFCIDESVITSTKITEIMPPTLTAVIDPQKTQQAERAWGEFLISQNGGDKLLAFKKLKQCTTPEGAAALQFTWENTNNETTPAILSFKLNQQEVGTCPLYQALCLADSTDVGNEKVTGQALISAVPMEPSDQTLAMSILDIAYDAILDRQKQPSQSEGIHSLIQEKTHQLVQTRYRPQEEIARPPVKPDTTSITKEDEKILRDINYGTFNWSGQFSLVGYHNTNKGSVEFELVHPLITYIRKTMHSPIVTSDYDNVLKINSHFLALANKEFKAYSENSENKDKIDLLLGKIYQAHDNTLVIFTPNTQGCRNYLR